MKVLVLADIHGANIAVESIIQRVKPALIILPGDIPSSIDIPSLFSSLNRTNFRKEYIKNFYHRFIHRANLRQISTMKLLLTNLLQYNIPILAIHGNTETKQSRTWIELFALRNPNLHYIADSYAVIGSYRFVGFGWTPIHQEEAVLHSPGEIRLDIEKDILLDTISKLPRGHTQDILISHTPPYDCDLDYLPHKKIHTGSQMVRNLLDTGYFEGVISGHLHEAYGAIRTENWWGVNAGAVVEDRACVIDLETKEVAWISQLIQAPNLESILYQKRISANYDG